ncbi:MAG: GNAT family N-acetyltransferase [Armatimonadota bacterium]|nr:GNAT family N-acetyltransferase [Armatimonadota bacterium]
MGSPRKAPVDATDQITIRPATIHDVPEIVGIWGQLAVHHARLDHAFAVAGNWEDEYRHFIRSLLGRDDALAVVGVQGDRLLGFAVGRISLLPPFFAQRRRGYIHDVVTREGFRRRGIGRRLVEALLEWMREAGVSVAELTVAVRNQEAVAFWEALGFSRYMYHMKRDLE